MKILTSYSRLKNYLPHLLIFFWLPSTSWSKNWANWLGPNHNGSLEELSLNIPGEGKNFSTRWKISVGSGWSSPLIDNGAVYFHDRVAENELIHRVDLLTGKEQWRHSYLSGYRDDFGMANGPRSTPALSQGILVTHGPQGLVHALDIENGKSIWIRDLKKDFSSSKGFFGRCSSPLIVEEQVIFDVGGPRAGLVSFSLRTGKTKWSTKAYGNDYASPVPFHANGQSLCLSFMREGFLSVDLVSGDEQFFESFRSPIDASVNAASPLVLGNQVFLTSCYEVGAGLWEYQTKSKGSSTFKKLWRKKEILDCHYSTPVAHGGYLFGFHGRQERGPVLRCIRLKDGLVKWEEASLGSGNLIKVGEQIFTLTDRGELIVFSADSNKCNILHRQQILGTGGRSHFAISDGLLIARDQRRLICLDLKVFE